MSDTNVEKPWVFLSYRRAHSGHWIARRIVSELDKHLGQGATFFDAGSIDGGQVWTQEIEDALAESAVVLVLIHPGWLDPRLQNADDWVRKEIETALRLGILIIPVLIDGAAMPAAPELPADIARLSSLQACFLEGRSEAALEATIRLLVQVIIEKVPCKISVRREPPPSWLKLYSWVVKVDDGSGVELRDADKEASFTTSPGIHTLKISWVEMEGFKSPKGTGASYSSQGESRKTMAFLPGEYTFTLKRDDDLRPWWKKLGSVLINNDSVPRTITEESFIPFTKPKGGFDS